MSELTIDQYPDWVLNNPKVEINGGNIRLYHYGDDNNTGELDPQYFGKHSYTSDVRQWDKPRTMFYISRLDKENRVQGFEYIVDYPLTKLYPFNDDPNYYYEECLKERGEKSLTVNMQLYCIGKKAEENGFDGFIMKWQSTLRVDIWKKVKASREEIKQDNKQENMKESVGNSRSINEDGYARIKNIMGGQVKSVQTIAILTAENPQAVQQNSETNNKLNDVLKADLKSGHYGYVQIKGKFGNIENPYFIMNITRNDAIDLGNKYDQMSIIFGSKKEDGDNVSFVFEYIEGNVTAQVREVVLSGSEIAKKNDNYSEYKGRKFLIPFFDNEYNNAKMDRGTVVGRVISDELVERVVNRIKNAINEQNTGKSRYDNRGMLKTILKENGFNTMYEQK